MFVSICASACARPVLQRIWPWLQRPSVLSMSFICGPCQTNGSWRLSPGRVPWPLPGSTVASGAPVPGIFQSAAKHQRKSPPSSFTFIKTVAPGSPRALGGCAKPAAADKLGPPLTAHLLCFLLIFPVPLSVWHGAPQHPSVGTALWSIGRILFWFLLEPWFFFFFVVCYVSLKQCTVDTVPSLKGRLHEAAFEPGFCVFQWLWPTLAQA